MLDPFDGVPADVTTTPRTDVAAERQAQNNLDRFARRALTLGAGTVEPHPLNFRAAQVAAENVAASQDSVVCGHCDGTGNSPIHRSTCSRCYGTGYTSPVKMTVQNPFDICRAAVVAQSVATDHGGIARHPNAKRAEERIFADLNLPTGGAR